MPDEYLTSCSHVHTWTDRTIILNWTDGNHKWFKTCIGNRISTIVDLIPPDKWRHVHLANNTTDCASRGLHPSKFLNHSFWWNGPTWLKESSSHWPDKLFLPPNQQEIDDKCPFTYLLKLYYQSSQSINSPTSSHWNALLHRQLVSFKVVYIRILLNGTKLMSQPINCKAAEKILD